jgi:ectoine hydroxylase-related dioxygenase (phytanoyl-CoA dioxygenase family)
VGGEAGKVLSPLIARLWPLLAIILQAEAAPLVGAGFMRVGPGAAGQELHKDVHGHDRHGGVAARGAEAGEAGVGGAGGAGVMGELVGGARAVSIQLQLSDTTAQPCMGSLEVLPGSHRPDAARARPEQIKRAVKEPTPSSGVLAVAVPAGSVTLYSSRLWHRGGANRGDRERTFCFLTVSEPDAPAPAGLIHTMERDEVGGWMLDHRGLQARSPERAKHKTSQRR